MRLQMLAAISALPGVSVAFIDSSPFFLLSTSSFDISSSADRIQSSFQAAKYTNEILSKCPTDRYLVVTQPGLNAADLRQSGGCAMPHLCQTLKNPRMKLQYVVAEVVGKTTEAGFVDEIRSACAGKGRIVQVDELRLASIPRDDRHNALSENDAFFAKSLEKAMETDSLTILFLSTPSEPTYEPDFVGSLHTDLKRSSRNIPVRRKNDDADWNKLPLFEKYQFFTPGIFMAIITVIVLFMILGVGLRALSSLEVSYGAFEKEMGPAAQKKQQ